VVENSLQSCISSPLAAFHFVALSGAPAAKPQLGEGSWFARPIFRQSFLVQGAAAPLYGSLRLASSIERLCHFKCSNAWAMIDKNSPKSSFSKQKKGGEVLCNTLSACII